MTTGIVHMYNKGHTMTISWFGKERSSCCRPTLWTFSLGTSADLQQSVFLTDGKKSFYYKYGYGIPFFAVSEIDCSIWAYMSILF